MTHGIQAIESQSITGRKANDMLYGQPFGNNFNQQMFNTPTPAPSVDERIWVTNQQAAEAYLVAANSFVRLWDSSQPRFYEKSADCTGRPMAMKIFEYKEVSPVQAIPQANYVTSEEFDSFRTKVNEFINSFEDSEVE